MCRGRCSSAKWGRRPDVNLSVSVHSGAPSPALTATGARPGTWVLYIAGEGGDPPWDATQISEPCVPARRARPPRSNSLDVIILLPTFSLQRLPLGHTEAKDSVGRRVLIMLTLLGSEDILFVI